MAVKEAAKSPERKPPAQAKTPTCACGRPLGADGMCDACRQKAMARPSKLGGHSFGRLSVTPAEHPIEREAKDLAEKAIQGRQVRVPERQSAGSVHADRRGGTPIVPPATARWLARESGGGQALPEKSRAQFETRFGQSLKSVRVHTGPRAEEAADSIDANAFAFGRDIVFGRGRFAPGTAAGDHLIAHELTHVLQGAPGLSRDPKSDPSANCPTGHDDGSAFSNEKDTSRYPSGAYVIWGTFHEGSRDMSVVAPEVADNWIKWRFGTLSPAVAARVRAEFLAQNWQWRGDPTSAQTGCQYRLDMPIEMMNRLVAIAQADVKGKKADEREKQAGMPALPDANIPDGAPGGGPGGGTDGGPGGGGPSPDPNAKKEAIEKALDPSSVYQAGGPGANAPPFPARIDGPQQEVSKAIGTYQMVLNYHAAASDPLIEIAYNLNYVQYHWELFDITKVVRNGLGLGAETEAGRVDKDDKAAMARLDASRKEEQKARSAAMDPNAEIGTLDAAQRRAEQKEEQFAQEEQTARAQLRDPESAAKGGSAVDVVSRYLANELSLDLLDVSKLIAAGGLSLGALGDFLSGPTAEQEVPFPNREGYFMIRCIAQPSPRGPNGSEIRAASVATKVVEIRKAEAVAKDVLGEPEAQLKELEVQKEMSKTADEKAAVDAKIKQAQLEATGDVVDLLKARLDAKTEEAKSATGYHKSKLDDEIAQLQLRYDQAVKQRVGAVGPHYRPRAVFVSQITGDSYPLLLDMSELPADQGKRVRMTDLTRPDHAPIERNGATLDQAMRNAFSELGSHGGLGRGTLAVRMPEGYPGSAKEFTIKTADENTAVVKQRLSDLAQVLMILGLFVPGLGEVSAVIGAALAVERIVERAVNGTLRVDAEFISDSVAILGAAAQGAQWIGKMRVARSGSAFVTAMKEADMAKLVAAAEAFDAARKTGETLESLNTLVGMGGLMWGNLVTLKQLGDLADQELAGGLSHSEARRQRAELLLGALRDNTIMFVGIAREGKSVRAGEEASHPVEEGAGKTGAGGEGTAEPGKVELGKVEEGKAEPAKEKPQQGETIPEEQLAKQSQTQADQGASGGKKVRTRFPTPDGLHEIFILEDGRIFRCSTRCAEMRTWYDSFLKGQTEDARKADAAKLDAELAKLEAAQKAGQNTKEVNDAIAALDVQMRDFIALDLAKELTATAIANGMNMGGLKEALTEAQTRKLLKFLDIDTIRSLVAPGAITDVQALKRFANRPENVLAEFRRVSDVYGIADPGAVAGLIKTVTNNKYTPVALESGYKQAAELKVKYGDRVSGELVDRCVRAAMGDKDKAAEVTFAIDALEGRTPLGSGQHVEGLLEQTTSTPDYATSDAGGERRLAEVKNLAGTPGTPLKLETISRNLRKALSQIRTEGLPTDKPGMVRLDARDATPTNLDTAAVLAEVNQKLRDSFVTDAASGTTAGPNVGFIELLYVDASGKPAKLVYAVSGKVATEVK